MTLRAFHQPVLPVGSTGPSSFNGDSALKEMGFGRGVYSIDSLKAVSSNLLALRNETNQEIFSTNFYLLAQQLEKQHNEEGAAQLYHALQRWSPDSKWGKAASHRQAILNGQGTLGEKIERAGHGILPVLGDPANLGAMYLGLRVFRGVSWGLMALAGDTAWTSRALATVGAYFFEVPTFTLTHRSLRSMQGLSNPTPFKEELIYNAKTLGALKATGLAGAYGVVALGQKGISHWALPQAAMFAGVLGAQGLEAADGSRKFHDAESFLVSAAATWTHFNLFGAALGPLVPQQPLLPAQTPRAPLAYLRLAEATAYGGEVMEASPPSRLNPTRVYTKGSSASSPPPPEVVIPFDDTAPRSSGIRPAGHHLIQDSMRKTFGEMMYSIQGLMWAGKIKGPGGFDSDVNWALMMLNINSQLMREVATLGHGLNEEAPNAQRTRILGDIQHELRQIDQTLREAGTKDEPVTSQPVKDFLNHYYRFPNLLGNFLDGTTQLEEGFNLLWPAQQSLKFLVRLEELPAKGYLFDDEVTSDYLTALQSSGGDLQKLYTLRGKTDEPKTDEPELFNASMGVQEFRDILKRVREDSKEKGHSPLLLDQMAGLQKDVESLVKRMNLLTQESPKFPAQSKADMFLNSLCQAHTSFGDFLMESNYRDLIATQGFMRDAHRYFDSVQHYFDTFQIE